MARDDLPICEHFVCINLANASLESRQCGGAERMEHLGVTSHRRHFSSSGYSVQFKIMGLVEMITLRYASRNLRLTV